MLTLEEKIAGCEAQRPGLLQHLRNHPVLSYAAIDFMNGLATKGIIIASAASFGVPQIQGAVERLLFMATGSTYTEAASIAMVGAATRFMLETFVAPPLLFKINGSNYRTGERVSVGDFARRYFGFAAGMRALETAVYVGVLGYVLDNGLFFLARDNPSQAEAILATSTGTGILLKPTRWALYTKIVLKANPLPIMVSKAAHAASAINDKIAYAALSFSAGTKKMAYATTNFITTRI